jgi:hypothetical protein
MTIQKKFKLQWNNLKKYHWMKNTYIFVWIHQIFKVQAIDDGPFILDLEIVILEIAKDFLSHVWAISIEK